MAMTSVFVRWQSRDREGTPVAPVINIHTPPPTSCAESQALSTRDNSAHDRDLVTVRNPFRPLAHAVPSRQPLDGGASENRWLM